MCLLRVVCRCISNKNDLVNLFFFVDGLHCNLNCLISPAIASRYFAQEMFEILRGTFKSCALQYFLGRSIVVAVDHDFYLKSSLDLTILKHLVSPNKRLTANAACFTKDSWHWTSGINGKYRSNIDISSFRNGSQVWNIFYNAILGEFSWVVRFYSLIMTLIWLFKHFFSVFKLFFGNFASFLLQKFMNISWVFQLICICLEPF